MWYWVKNLSYAQFFIKLCIKGSYQQFDKEYDGKFSLKVMTIIEHGNTFKLIRTLTLLI